MPDQDDDDVRVKLLNPVKVCAHESTWSVEQGGLLTC